MVGGAIYCGLEQIFRGHTHWTMGVVGGVAFILCGLVNEVIPWEMVFWKQMLLCAVLITVVEFIAGCVLNLWLGLGIWDYSNLPFNILGQICLPFTVLWFFVSAVAIILDDYGAKQRRCLWNRSSRTGLLRGVRSYADGDPVRSSVLLRTGFLCIT